MRQARGCSSYPLALLSEGTKHDLQQRPGSGRGRLSRHDDVPSQRAEGARRQQSSMIFRARLLNGSLGSYGTAVTTTQATSDALRDGLSLTT